MANQTQAFEQASTAHPRSRSVGMWLVMASLSGMAVSILLWIIDGLASALASYLLTVLVIGAAVFLLVVRKLRT